MKSSFHVAMAALLLSSLLCGCIRYHYEGKQLPPTGKPVKVFWKKIEIARPYEVMGEAEVWGNYQDCSRGSLLEKLENKAAAAGADAILVLRYAVRTGERVSGGDGTFIGGLDTDNSGSGIKQAEQSMDRTYGNARGRGSSSSNIAGVVTIRRYMTVQYLRYTNQAAGKPAAVPVKKNDTAAQKTTVQPALSTTAEVPTFRSATTAAKAEKNKKDNAAKRSELPLKTAEKKAPETAAAAPAAKHAAPVLVQDPRQRVEIPAEKKEK